METWPCHRWERNMALDCLPLPSPNWWWWSVVPATSWDLLKLNFKFVTEGITITTLHHGCIRTPSWWTRMRHQILNGNSVVWHFFFLNSETCSLTPCVEVLQGHPERLINVTQQPRPCSPSSPCQYLTWEQRYSAWPKYCYDFLEQIQKPQSFAARSQIKKKKKRKKKLLGGKKKHPVKFSWVRRTVTFPVHCSEPGGQCQSPNTRNCWVGSKGLGYTGQARWSNSPPDLKSINHIN